jgi:hypothetical protein
MAQPYVTSSFSTLGQPTTGTFAATQVPCRSIAATVSLYVLPLPLPPMSFAFRWNLQQIKLDEEGTRLQHVTDSTNGLVYCYMQLSPCLDPCLGPCAAVCVCFADHILLLTPLFLRQG